MAMKYCDRHDIWYDYKEGCPECGKVGRIAGSIIGNVIGGTAVASMMAFRKIREYSKQQKEINARKITSIIEDVWQEHDVIVNGELGMRIHVKFQINNMLNLTGSCNAYFWDKKKKPLLDTNYNYCSSDGQVSTGLSITPPYQNCTYNDFVLFIPYNELHLPLGHHQLKFHVEVFDNNQNSLTISKYYEFNVNWQGQNNNRITATIDDVWQENNVIVNGEIGMKMHVKFQVNNMLKLTGSCNAYFFDINEKKLLDTNHSYCSSDGQVSVGLSITPPYQNCTYNDFVLFIPYNELHLPLGQHQLKFYIEVFDNNQNSLVQSSYFRFYVNWQGKERKG